MSVDGEYLIQGNAHQKVRASSGRVPLRPRRRWVLNALVSGADVLACGGRIGFSPRKRTRVASGFVVGLNSRIRKRSACGELLQRRPVVAVSP